MRLQADNRGNVTAPYRTNNPQPGYGGNTFNTARPAAVPAAEYHATPATTTPAVATRRLPFRATRPAGRCTGPDVYLS